jgi:hypothetical protein
MSSWRDFRDAAGVCRQLVWAAIYRAWGMNQLVASCLASGAVAHWLILLSVVQLTRG